jgi:hypothetical protein
VIIADLEGHPVLMGEEAAASIDSTESETMWRQMMGSRPHPEITNVGLFDVLGRFLGYRIKQ